MQKVNYLQNDYILEGKFIMTPSSGKCGLGSHMCASNHDLLCYHHFTLAKTEPSYGHFTMAKISANGWKIFED
jgi:hypothetical protein